MFDLENFLPVAYNMNGEPLFSIERMAYEKEVDMATKDLASKKIEDYNEVFADIYNTLLFGRNVLCPDGLRAGATESIYKTDGRDVNDQRRDILKKYHGKASLLISSLGIENQTRVDKLMPLRVLGYDFGIYRQQVIGGEKKITPVITIVLNFSDRKWRAAKSLFEMLDIAPDWREYVQDYKIHVFDIAFLEDQIIESFTSDFREIAMFFKRRRLGENPLASNRELSHPQAVLEFISAFTQDERYLDGMQYLNDRKERGGAVTMCEVAEALITQGKLEGRLEGKVELLFEMDFAISDISEKLNISVEKVKAILKLD